MGKTMNIIKGEPDKELKRLIKESFEKKEYIAYGQGKIRDKKLIQILKDEGFKVIVSGKSRDIFIKGKYVLKLPRNKEGYISNKLEVRTYNKITPKKHLAKIYSYDKRYRWLVMERIEIPDYEKCVKHAMKLRSIYNNIQDIHVKNVGEKNGIPVLLDYGGHYL
jgi:hypothetical protein